MEKIIKVNYYIIKVICDNSKKVYYKIGEAISNKRPETLINKYREFRSNNAELLTFNELPYNKTKRLNDKTIHKMIDQTILKSADPVYIEHYLKETDGITEFFEPVNKMTDTEVVTYIQTIINQSKSSMYTVKLKTNMRLEYDKTKKHLVNHDIIENYILKNKKAKDILYNDIGNTIILIGQFDPDWIRNFAAFHQVIIWHDTKDQKYEYQYNVVKSNITYVEDLEELLNIIGGKNMNKCLIIANPPYGKIGANITQTIIENIEFDEYVNLLPANDYKRNDSKDLYNYQSDMISIKDGFADASVTTHLAKIHKTKVNNMTLDEFERSQYIDRQLDKYFEENSKRSHYAIDAAVYKPKLATFKTDFDLARCLFIGKRYVSDEHLPYTKKAAGYLVNKERNITHDQLIAMSAKSEQANGNVGDFSLAQFNTVTEQNNITDFMYSKEGFKFIAKVLVSLNADSYCHMNKFIPKVDWSRAWTVEEILTDYGYTTDEINEVMEDLNNYKGMENEDEAIRRSKE